MAAYASCLRTGKSRHFADLVNEGGAVAKAGPASRGGLGIELSGLPAGEFVFNGGGHGGGGAGCRLGPAAAGGEVTVAGHADAGSKRDRTAATE